MDFSSAGSSALPSPTILRSNHTRDNSGVTDDSYPSSAVTALSSRRPSTNSFEIGHNSVPYSPTNGMDSLSLNYHTSSMTLPGPHYLPYQSHGMAFDPARQDVNHTHAPTYYSQPNTNWNMYSAPHSDNSSMPAFYHPTSSPAVEPGYAYSHMSLPHSSPSMMPLVIAPHMASIKRDGEHDVYENTSGW